MTNFGERAPAALGIVLAVWRRLAPNALLQVNRMFHTRNTHAPQPAGQGPDSVQASVEFWPAVSGIRPATRSI
jgi:hypothetical protein